jgi:hypothetical protein
MRKYLIGIAAVLFPSVLLWPEGEGFARDWSNHVWMIGYYGEYFRQHHSFPAVANTAEVGGMAFPLFYGCLFYPLFGLAATHLHPEIAVRLTAVAMFAAQYVAIRTTARRLGAGEGLAAGLACATIWSVYGLTNLYSRAALTEFFAVGVLTCAVCSWIDLLRSPSAAAAWLAGLRFGLFLTLAMGFHPITGAYSLTVLAVLAVGLVGRTAPLARVVSVCATGAAGATVALAPWLYTVHTFEPYLSIENPPLQIADCSAHLDRWQTRLNPLPADARCNDAPIKDVSTPYLDCQIAYPLLILGAAGAFATLRPLRGRARLAGAALAALPLGYAAAMLYLSLRPEAFDDLPAVFKKVQFLYRLVSYVNLGFLLVPMFALLWAARVRARAAAPGAAGPVAVPPALLAAVLTYAGLCAVLKLQHAELARIPAEPVVRYWAERGLPYRQHADHRRWVKSEGDRASMARLPMSSYGHSAYNTPDYLTPLPPEVEAQTPFVPFGVETRGGYFGETHRQTVTLNRSGYVATEILVFPWNRFEVDGQVVSATDLRSWNSARVNLYQLPPPWTAVPVPAGTHTIQHKFEPDKTWRQLNAASQVCLAVWALSIGGLAVANLRRRSAAPALKVVSDPPEQQQDQTRRAA